MGCVQGSQAPRSGPRHASSCVQTWQARGSCSESCSLPGLTLTLRTRSHRNLRELPHLWPQNNDDTIPPLGLHEGQRPRGSLSFSSPPESCTGLSPTDPAPGSPPPACVCTCECELVSVYVHVLYVCVTPSKTGSPMKRELTSPVGWPYSVLIQLVVKGQRPRR